MNKQKHDLECLEKSFQYKIEQQAIVNFQRCSNNLVPKTGSKDIDINKIDFDNLLSKP